MKHASAPALATLAELLRAIRAESRLAEKKPGIFYLGARAYLHFHEDPAGIFADIRTTGDWERIDVSTATGCALLLGRLCSHLATVPAKNPRAKRQA